MSKRRKIKGRADRIRREAAARAARTAHTTPTALPVTEASQALATALDDAGHHTLADRARRLEFDENYSRSALPLHDLVAALMLADLPELVQRVNNGDFDSTAADNTAYYATPRGRAERAELDAEIAALPPELLAELTAKMGALGDDPAAQQRMIEQHQGQMLLDLGLSEPAPDDDTIVDAADLRPDVVQLLGATAPAPDGRRLDTPEILACADVVSRGGGTEFVIDCNGDFTEWQVQVTYRGTARGDVVVRSEARPTPAGAARNLVEKTMVGGQCLDCGRVISLDPRGFYAADRRLHDGRLWTADEQAQAGMCLWRRRGPHWRKGCEQPG